MKNKYLLIISFILFILITLLVITGYSYYYEEAFYNLLSITKTKTSIMKIITFFGGQIFVSLLCIILLFIPKLSYKIGTPITITIIINGIINIILKNIFMRQRPNINQLVNEVGFSYPSGHSMNIIAITTMLSLLLFRYLKNKKKVYCITILLFLITLLVGFSRIYLGVHYLGDVIGGFLIGYVITTIIYYLWDKYTKNS